MSTFVERQPAPEVIEARHWQTEADTQPILDWCEGWTYTGTAHGHTDPHWAMHTCLNLETRDSSPKGHADPGDWIVRHADGTFEIFPPEAFVRKYKLP